MQPLIDKVAGKLPAWKGKLLNKWGIFDELSPLGVAYLFPHSVCSEEMGDEEDRQRRNFLWKGSEEANGGHCLVKWKMVTASKKLGGLGILNLELHSRALSQVVMVCLD